MGFLYNRKLKEWVFIGSAELFEKYTEAINDYLDWMREDNVKSIPSKIGRPVSGSGRRRKKKGDITVK